MKQESKLVTYVAGSAKSTVDYIMVRQGDKVKVCNVKVIPNKECKIHFMSKSCVLLYWHHFCTALQQRASAKLCGVVQGMELRNFRRGCHVYSVWQPSRWASTHILVNFDLPGVTDVNVNTAGTHIANCSNLCLHFYYYDDIIAINTQI